jgi:hypothetical protein
MTTSVYGWALKQSARPVSCWCAGLALEAKWGHYQSLDDDPRSSAYVCDVVNTVTYGELTRRVRCSYAVITSPTPPAAAPEGQPQPLLEELIRDYDPVGAVKGSISSQRD